MSHLAAAPRPVSLKRKALEDYRAIAGDDLIASARQVAMNLRGLRVLELSATATGGGVAEMLASLVPLERDVGIDAEWHILAGDTRFFDVTKRIHNGLQGMPDELGGAERDEYLRHNEATAKALDDRWDVIVIHDPQPAAVRHFASDFGGRWIWRCHIDSSNAQPAIWEFLRPLIQRHDRAVFTLEAFVPADLGIPTTMLLPAIDPLSSKNRDLPAYLARETVAELGVDLSRPLLLQVSRFDPWKDPIGVVSVWRRVRETFPELQLALVGSMAGDDPEGWRIYAGIERETAGESGCLLLTDQMGVAGHEVNAFQRVADVAIQKSIREGFGLVVSETLWKGTPMVAGAAGGIPMQLEHGISGYLASSVDDFAARTLELLEHPVRGREFGAAGAAHVRDRFLLPRLLRDHLQLLADTIA